MRNCYIAAFVLCLSCGQISGTGLTTISHSDNGGTADNGGEATYAGSSGEAIYNVAQSGSSGTVNIDNGGSNYTGGTVVVENSGSPSVPNGGSSGTTSSYIDEDIHLVKSTGGVGGGKFSAELAGSVSFDYAGAAGSIYIAGSAGLINTAGSATDTNQYTVVDDMSSLDGWILNTNEGSNPIVSCNSDGEIIQFSAIGETESACGTIYNYKEYLFNQTMSSDSIELCFALDASRITSPEPSFYNFSSVSFDLYNDDSLAIRNFFYTPESIGEYWEQNLLTDDFIELSADGCQQISFTQTVMFNKIVLSAINYTCVGTNYVIFDELRLLDQ